MVTKDGNGTQMGLHLHIQIMLIFIHLEYPPTTSDLSFWGVNSSQIVNFIDELPGTVYYGHSAKAGSSGWYASLTSYYGGSIHTLYDTYNVSKKYVNLIHNAERSSNSQSKSIVAQINNEPKTDLNKFSLNVYPNPFNSATNINFELSEASDITLEVFDITGRKYLSYQDTRGAGVHNIPFGGNNFATGVYIVRLITKFGSQNMKITLIK